MEENLNNIMAYVERCLDSELDTELDIDEISRLAACPYAMFQRVFVVITNISFVEYVRNRKLTRAAHDLVNTQERVIDIALRYGYESPDAFTAAFKRVIGLSPSQVRNGKYQIRHYPPLRFKFKIIGVTDMAEVIKTYKQKMPATRFIGKKYGDEDRVGGLFGAKWGEWHENGWFMEIEDAAGYNKDFFEDASASIGLMRHKNGEPFQYWIGRFASEGTAVPEGFDYIDMPPRTLGVCWIRGMEPDIYGKDDLVMEAFRENGIAPLTDSEGAFWFFERYADVRFTDIDDDGCVILDHCYYVAE